MPIPVRPDYDGGRGGWKPRFLLPSANRDGQTGTSAFLGLASIGPLPSAILGAVLTVLAAAAAWRVGPRVTPALWQDGFYIALAGSWLFALAWLFYPLAFKREERQIPRHNISELFWSVVSVTIVVGVLAWLIWASRWIIGVSVWLPFVIGFVINLALVWSLLLGRDALRRRRLEVVAYLAGFLVGPVGCDCGADESGAANDKDTTSAVMKIMPASFRLALEKYLFDLDGYAQMKSKDDSLLMEWEAYAEGYRDRCEGRPVNPLACDNPYQMVVRILKRLSSALELQDSPAIRIKTFLMWLPAYLPFVAIAGLFFVQFFPTPIYMSCVKTWLADGAAPGQLCIDTAQATQANFWPVARFWQAATMSNNFGSYEASLFVATFAYAGAYLSTWRSFIRGAVSNDLSPMTFFRAMRHCMTAVIVAVVAFNTLAPLHIGYGAQTPAAQTPAVQTPAAQKSAAQASASQDAPPSGVASSDNTSATSATSSDADASAASSCQDCGQMPGVETPAAGTNASGPGEGNPAMAILWLLTAFVIGFYPDLGLSMLLRSRQLDDAKKVYDGVGKDFEIVPIDIVDGIDYDARTRLAEFGITDIQHLATYNPIVMFAETPSLGLYQAIDWVAQAQLCNAVGIQAFVRLRQWRIRSIFDLERVIANDQDLPDYVAAVVEALVQTSPQAAAIQKGLQAGAATSGQMNTKAVNLIVTVMMDDLHVMRLRQLWWIIKTRLGPNSETLFPASLPSGAPDARPRPTPTSSTAGPDPDDIRDGGRGGA